MLLKLCANGEGVFKPEFRVQLLVSLCVTIMTFCHGIGTGWISPTLVRLQSVENTPLSFSLNVGETSWIGALVCVGGMIGNVVFGYLVDRIGRKKSLYCVAVPHLCFWVLIYFANSIELLATARVLAGMTGGGVYVVTPIFIGEISDPTIRGRLTSLFTLTLNTGILVGYIAAAYLPYHLIPCLAIVLPLLFLWLLAYFSETPQYLLRHGHIVEAKNSLESYRRLHTKADAEKLAACFQDLRNAVDEEQKQSAGVGIRDFLTKPALKALGTGVILMLVNAFSGSFALITYMSNVFAAAKTEMHPNNNTIIIGVVQVIGTYTALTLVDRYGRKILLLVSTAAMATGLGLFGLYAFIVEQSDVDLSHFSWWLPLLLVALIIFAANIGVIPVSIVVLIEIMPVKIRAKATSLCMTLVSALIFCTLKIFPIFMDVFGLSATMWFCASASALGLFYVATFLQETKGKSMDRD